MEQRAIGELSVSVVGVGCNNFGSRVDERGTAAVVNAALDAGITLFDTADIYGGTLSEQFLGKALRSRRDEVVIATKFGGQVGDDPAAKGGSARWVKRAAEDSLRRLGTDRIDLYQYHFPDADVPIEETLGALNELVAEGKVRHVGNSNFDAEQIAAAEDAAARRGWARFVCAQNHYSLLHREVEAEVLPACVQHGLAMLPYFPLASGVLKGKYDSVDDLPAGTRLAAIPPERRANWLTEDTLATVAKLSAFAAESGRSLLELAFGWLLAKRPVASVIAGATTPEQVAANAAAAGWAMTASEVAAIDEISAA